VVRKWRASMTTNISWEVEKKKKTVKEKPERT
jgi:hypothetical protein